MKIPRPLVAILTFVSAFVVQAIGYAASEDVGDFSTLVAVAIVAVGCWLVGGMFSRRLTFLAALSGAAVGFVFWLIDWQFLRFLRIQVLGQFSESNIIWIAGLYALLMWPTVLLCAVVAGAAAWRNTSQETDAGGSAVG